MFRFWFLCLGLLWCGRPLLAVEQEVEFIEYDREKEFKECVDRLQQEYYLLTQIFNDFGEVVGYQGEQLKFVFKCCQKTFESMMSSIIQLESVKRAKITSPWMGYGTWLVSSVGAIVIGATGLLVPAIVVASTGGVLGGIDVGYKMLTHANSVKKTEKIIAITHSASEVIDDHFFDEAFSPNLNCQHAGSATAYELHRQMTALIRVEKIFDVLLKLRVEPDAMERPFERVDDYEEQPCDLTNPHDILTRLQKNLDVDEKLAHFFALNLEEQDKLVERLLEKSARLNGLVLHNICEAKKLLALL